MNQSKEERAASIAERLNTSISHLISIKELPHVSFQTIVANKLGSNNSTNVNYALNGNPRYATDGFVKRFNNAFENIFNEEWLLNGSGTMLIDSAEIISETPTINYTSGVPYYNIDFLGGFDSLINCQEATPEYLIDFKKYNKATCWCNVTGHSMEPEITHGDIIALREIKDISFLPLGEVYAIVTTNEMRTIKRLGAGSDKDHYSLVPTNKSPEYGIQEIPKSMVHKVFSVLGCMKRL